MKNLNTIPSLGYGSEKQNVYNKIATFLRCALPRPQPEPQPTPFPEQRLHDQPTSLPEQRVYDPHPASIKDPETYIMVTVIPLPPVVQSFVQSQRVVPPNPLPSYSPLGLGLPPAQSPVLIPPSP